MADKQRRFRLPERWYRDFWLFVISGVVVLALAADERRDDDIAKQADRIEDVAAQDVRRAERNARQSRVQIIAAGASSVYQGCLRDIRDVHRENRQEKRSIPALVKDGTISPQLGEAALRLNRERRREFTRALCEDQRRQFRHTALNGRP